MQKIIVGVVLGYLTTSYFLFPFPPASFWWILAIATTIFAYLYSVWWRFDNDSYGDLDE